MSKKLICRIIQHRAPTIQYTHIKDSVCSIIRVKSGILIALKPCFQSRINTSCPPCAHRIRCFHKSPIVSGTNIQQSARGSYLIVYLCKWNFQEIAISSVIMSISHLPTCSTALLRKRVKTPEIVLILPMTDWARLIPPTMLVYSIA